MDDIKETLHTRIDESREPELAYEDRMMTEAEAAERNEKLARHGDPCRWREQTEPGSRDREEAA